jgi:hypothetical protein
MSKNIRQYGRLLRDLIFREISYFKWHFIRDIDKWSTN